LIVHAHGVQRSQVTAERLQYSAGNSRLITWMMSGIDTGEISRNSLIR